MNGTRICSVEDCARPVYAYGMCSMHHRRKLRNGHTGLRKPQDLGEYIAARVKVGARPAARPGLSPCHIWRLTPADNGYAYIGLRTHHKMLAHRAAYELKFGPIPDGHVIDHLCRVRACVNPDHLEPVSNAENLRRGRGFRLRNGMDHACIHGHAYTDENTYINPNDDTDIRCRECSRVRDRKRKRAA